MGHAGPLRLGPRFGGRVRVRVGRGKGRGRGRLLRFAFFWPSAAFLFFRGQDRRSDRRRRSLLGVSVSVVPSPGSGASEVQSTTTTALSCCSFLAQCSAPRSGPLGCRRLASRSLSVAMCVRSDACLLSASFSPRRPPTHSYPFTHRPSSSGTSSPRCACVPPKKPSSSGSTTPTWASGLEQEIGVSTLEKEGGPGVGGRRREAFACTPSWA
ncbi:hypothetical protein B0H12DRAFT_421878 [Mycena haematopus]|nr:hypothetical protein B0H12DRAFT_421878 [Mycena haematopus]